MPGLKFNYVSKRGYWAHVDDPCYTQWYPYNHQAGTIKLSMIWVFRPVQRVMWTEISLYWYSSVSLWSANYHWKWTIDLLIGQRHVVFACLMFPWWEKSRLFLGCYLTTFFTSKWTIWLCCSDVIRVFSVTSTQTLRFFFLYSEIVTYLMDQFE